MEDLIYDIFACVIGIQSFILLVGLLCLCIYFDIKKTSLRSDYVKTLNEHDTKVISDFLSIHPFNFKNRNNDERKKTIDKGKNESGSVKE